MRQPGQVCANATGQLARARRQDARTSGWLHRNAGASGEWRFGSIQVDRRAILEKEAMRVLTPTASAGALGGSRSCPIRTRQSDDCRGTGPPPFWRGRKRPAAGCRASEVADFEFRNQRSCAGHRVSYLVALLWIHITAIKSSARKRFATRYNFVSLEFPLFSAVERALYRWKY